MMVRERGRERGIEGAGGRFMESTYPEIYMKPWQEMRRMQKREAGRMAERCQVRMTLAQSSFLGKFGGNGDGCGGGGGGGRGDEW